MKTPSGNARYLRFDRFVVDRRARRLLRDGRELAIQDKPLRLLEALLLAENDVVTRDELVTALWPDGEFVDYESGIHTAARKLRDSLGDSASAPRWVETMPRVGYRFLGEVRIGEIPGDRAANAEVPVSAREEVSALEEVGETRRVRAPITMAGAGVSVAAVLVLATLVRLPGRGEDGELTPPSQPVASAQVRTTPRHADAREAYREALFLLQEQPAPPPLAAVELLERVTREEPGFAPAYGHLAEAWTRRAVTDPTCDECLRRARDAARAALDRDPDQVEALLAQGQLALLFSWDAAAARRKIEHGVALAPHSATAQLSLATWLAATGRNAEAIVAVRRAMDLEPASFAVRADLGFFLLASGADREAARVCERAAQLSPEFVHAHRCALFAYERLGDEARAAEAARRVLALSDSSPGVLASFDGLEPGEQIRFFWTVGLEQLLESPDPSPLSVAAHQAMLGDSVRAVDFLEQAYAERSAMLALLPFFAEFRELHRDPGYLDLVDRVGVLTVEPSRVTRIGS